MTQQRHSLEVCSNSLQSAINAQSAGATRVELCENFGIGGTTPSWAAIKLARHHLSIGLHVLVRPRGGDFLYSPLEFETILEDIANAKALGAAGVVCGILRPNGNIDIDRTRLLVEHARPMVFTFHRAFDFTPNPLVALEDVIATGANIILTSGHQETAIKGLALIRELVIKSNGRIRIMPGGGITTSNIKELASTGAMDFHLSGISKTNSGMVYRKEGLSLTKNPELDYEIEVSDKERIKEVSVILNRLIE